MKTKTNCRFHSLSTVFGGLHWLPRRRSFFPECKLIFLQRHLHLLTLTKPRKTIWNSPTSKLVDTALLFSIGHWPSWWDRWWCWGWRGYLPTSRISAEIAKRRCKPSVDFVKSQLLLGGFSNCLEKGKALLLSPLRLEFAAKMNWELFAFSKSWQSELGSLQGLTLLSKLSLL